MSVAMCVCRLDPNKDYNNGISYCSVLVAL